MLPIKKFPLPLLTGLPKALVFRNRSNTWPLNWPLIHLSAMIRFGGDTPILEVGFVHLVDQLIAYEEGLVTGDEQIALFQHLIDTGTCWHLEGHYHRVAATLIETGLIKPPEWAKATL